jgi:hypothetical protein
MGHFFGYGAILQAIAIVHFIRRRPDTYWLFIIFFGGAIGALIYIVIEVLPDAGLLGQQFRIVQHRSRIHELERIVIDNPAIANLEELGDLYLEQKQYARAKQYYDRVISPRTDYPDPFYHRAICELELGQSGEAVADLETVVRKDPGFAFHRAAGLLAHAYALTGRHDDAAKAFAAALEKSTLSETQFNYAQFLAQQGRPAEAREWAERLLAKKANMPRFMRRAERPWFRRATGLLKRLPAQAEAGAQA